MGDDNIFLRDRDEFLLLDEDPATNRVAEPKRITEIDTLIHGSSFLLSQHIELVSGTVVVCLVLRNQATGQEERKSIIFSKEAA